MRAITKGPEPASLTRHRATVYSDYNNYADKDKLRHALVTEQRGLCCYCMGPICPSRKSMKIEHWRCRASYPREQLNYCNLLGACPGGEGQPARLQHCDTRKGDRDLRWNPAKPLHRIETRVQYESNGLIRADNADFNDQINDVLNLNLPLLKNNRKRSLDALLRWLELEKTRIGNSVPRKRLVWKRDRLVSGNAELAPYCQVAVWWLDQLIAGMAA